jgi:tetratricopeptide (TPR) repeat protein
VAAENWERRLADLWTTLDERPDDEFVAAVDALAGELAADDGRGPFERAAARDSTGRSDLAVPLYRRALDLGLADERRRRAVIQLASSLRNLGELAAAVELLEAELARTSDDLDDAVRAFLALALIDSGRAPEALCHALTALAPHLPRYQRSVANYARLLVEDEPA